MTERIWAVINDGVIANTIVADDVFANIIRPEHDDVAEITNVAPRPGVGWSVEAEGYRRPQPGPSWEWDEAAQEWIDVTPEPEPDPQQNVSE